MNTDIRLSTEFFRHPKTRKLKKRLGLDGVVALLQLWVWCAQNRPSGVMSGLDMEDVALAACWDGEDTEEVFVQTLIDLRWLDVLDDGTFCLHNWEARQEYASKSEERREKARKAAVARWSKSDAQAMPEASADMPRNSMGTNRHGASNAKPMPENACSNAKACNEHKQAMPLTEPNQTDHVEIQDPPLPPLGEPDASASAVSASGDGDEHVELVGESPATEPEQAAKPAMPSRRKDDFVAWYGAYPRKRDRDDAVKAWDAACRAKRLPPLAALLETLAWQTESFDWTKEGGKWIPYPAKYLRAGSWQDEPPARKRRYYGPDSNGRSPYVNEDEQNFENVPRDANGGVDWAQVMGGAK